MSILDFLRRPKIDDEVKLFRETEGAVLLDVRTRKEYDRGRIPGSKNIPLQEIQSTEDVIPDKNTPLFVYCLSGGRSSQAVSELMRMGYQNVKNIGGISDYKGTLEL
ncbi:MAG: rhodanese-like domain-containing protein [Firmicutes bacterium]|nr:rhodanese-like domain-containing protein [Bacillota bacterium]